MICKIESGIQNGGQQSGAIYVDLICVYRI